MVSGWRAVRRRVLTPPESDTRLAVRGFPIVDERRRELLESIGATFLTGFGAAAQARVPADATPELDAVPAAMRGFGYEGAAMAFALLDALPVPGAGRFAGFLAGAGAPHTYMLHVGAGWALARLPRAVHRRLPVTDPLLRWLALDGYGFHQAYFHTARYVRDQHRDACPSWPADGPADYRARAVDQGVGRALWFVCGADPERVTRTVRSFDRARHADLWSGVGLAATYAGGVPPEGLRGLRDDAGEHRPALAQGSAFAAQARLRAGLATPGTAAATEVFCAMPPEKAARVTDDTLPVDTAGAVLDGVPVPAYEVWRRRIADRFA